MKSLETIANEITLLESERDFGDITPEGMELLAVLNLCYDLLTRTKKAQGILINQPEEMKEEGFEDDLIQAYGVPSSALANFSFAIATKSGHVDLRKLLKEVKFSHTDKSIAESVGIRRATISEYMNHKSSFNADTYEKIINYTLTRNAETTSGIL